MSKCKVITIDGTSGVGKGTLALKLVQYLNSSYLDSGAIYRACALYLQQCGIEIKNNYSEAELKEVLPLLDKLPLDFKESDGQLFVYLGKEDVTKSIRMESTGALASLLASQTPIRQSLINVQKDFATGKEVLVAEGRDMGTAIFPEALAKIYLDASPEVKAERRYLELINKGEKVDFNAILESLEKRDYQDKNRACNPLRAACDAKTIDTSHLNKEEVFKEAILFLKEKGIV